MRTYFVVSFLLGGVACYITALWAYFANKSKQVNISWALLGLAAGTWSLGHFIMAITRNYQLAWVSCNILYGAAVLIPFLYLYFVYALIDAISSKRREIVYSFLVSFLLLFPLYPLKLFVKDVIPKSVFNYYDELKQPAVLFFLFFVIVPTYALFRLLQALRKVRGIKKVQLQYVFLASVFGFVGGGSTFLLAFNIKIPPYPIVLFPLYPIIITYAIIRYRLMDINVALTRAGVFSVVYAFVLGVPFGVIVWARTWLQGYGYYGILIPTTIMAVFASAGPFIYTKICRRAENRLRREEFLAHQALNNLAQDMMRFTKLQTLLKLIVHQVVKIMKVNSASIYIKDEQNEHYHLRASWSVDDTSPEQSKFSEESALLKDILLRQIPLVAEELKISHTPEVSSHMKKLQMELQRARAAVVIPAFKGGAPFGFLILGERRDSRLFTQQDLNLLTLLGNQSVLAIENAQLFEKEKTLLAEKSRRDALADMAPGVAHQFNNRLMSITTAAEMQKALLEQKDSKEFSPEEIAALIEQTKTTLDSIVNDTMRGKDIANAILKKGKAKLAYVKTDLAPIIQSSIDLLKMSRTKSTLEGNPEPEVILTTEDNLPKLTLNESLIQDVFYNIIDNARDAIIIKNKAINEHKLTPTTAPYKGKITVTLAKKDNKVEVTVNDNGIGMDEKTKARLFVPYFTTKATALKGTGMGLWVIRSFVEEHKGKISFESEYTKGATFTITFPIKEG